MSPFPGAADFRSPVVGLGAFVAVAESLGRHTDAKVSRLQAFIHGPRAARQPNAVMEQAARRLCRACSADLAEALAAMGSAHRLAILAKLLEGSATYRSLQRHTGLKVGPLYHHINQLRLAGLVGPKTRDVYVLTRAGRNAFLTILCVGRLLKDARPRPMPGA